ncbi:MAG: glycosyl hydrolase, partial [Polyangiales bacterium]
NSPTFWAFRAFRDFDGQGGRFLDRSLPTKAEAGASIFASRDASGKHLVIIVLDVLSDQPLTPTITLEGCGKIASERAFQYAGGEAGIALAKTSLQKPAPLPPFSITIHDVQLDAPLSAGP